VPVCEKRIWNANGANQNYLHLHTHSTLNNISKSIAFATRTYGPKDLLSYILFLLTQTNIVNGLVKHFVSHNTHIQYYSTARFSDTTHPIQTKHKLYITNFINPCFFKLNL